MKRELTAHTTIKFLEFGNACDIAKTSECMCNSVVVCKKHRLHHEFFRTVNVVRQFLTAGKVSNCEIFIRIQNVHGAECISSRSAFRWCSDIVVKDDHYISLSSVLFLSFRKSLHYPNTARRDIRSVHTYFAFCDRFH